MRASYSTTTVTAQVEEFVSVNQLIIPVVSTADFRAGDDILVGMSYYKITNVTSTALIVFPMDRIIPVGSDVVLLREDLTDS